MPDANQILSVPFTDLGTLGGAFRAILKKWLQGSVDGMLPATVLSVDAQRSFAQVQPLIMVVGTDGSTTSRAQVAKVPIFTAGAGGFVMSWPIKAGDLGWIIANDRDISLYLQSGQESPPNTAKLHSFSQGLFIPDAARQWVLSDEDQANVVWQSYDGTVKIALTPELVQIAPSVKVAGGAGFFGVAPPASQPSVTGTLSAVTDANAKAVLTSIIAVLAGNGEAKNGTI